MTHPKSSEIAQDVVLKWTSDKTVSIKMHGGITTGNDILLTDCIKKALNQSFSDGIKAGLMRAKEIIQSDIAYMSYNQNEEIMRAIQSEIDGLTEGVKHE